LLKYYEYTEYQGKAILKKYGVRIPEGKVAFSPAEAKSIACEIAASTGVDTWAVKAQIHAEGEVKEEE
jgi:succinyl-CoA synthetase beta subunit